MLSLAFLTVLVMLRLVVSFDGIIIRGLLLLWIENFVIIWIKHNLKIYGGQFDFCFSFFGFGLIWFY